MNTKDKNTQENVSLLTTITDADFGLGFSDFDASMEYEVKIVFFNDAQKKVLGIKKDDTYALPHSKIKSEQVDENAFVQWCKEKLKSDVQFFVPLGKIIEKKMVSKSKKLSYGYLVVLQTPVVTVEEGIQRDANQKLVRISFEEIVTFMKKNFSKDKDYDAKFEAKKDFYFLTVAEEYFEKKGKNEKRKKSKLESESKSENQEEQLLQKQPEHKKQDGKDSQSVDNGDIVRLQKQLEEMQAIASKAQYDYVTLKMDFDSYRNRMEKQLTEGKVDILIDVVRKFLPFIESLRKSLLTLPEDFKQQSFGKGLQMMYENFLNSLATMSIVPIDTQIGQVPDVTFHEPIGVQSVEDTNLKGKIIMEVEQGFVYKQGDVQKVIKTSKVIIGQ